MALTAETFRQVFPEFRDTQQWTDPIVEFWLANATALTNADRWGPSFDLGVGLFVAHNLVLSGLDGMSAAAGGVPGLALSGAVSSKSGDGLSVSYDTSGSAEADAGNWGLTTYGTRYLRLLRLHGAGPIQLSGAGDSSSGDSGGFSSAWMGPYTYPF